MTRRQIRHSRECGNPGSDSDALTLPSPALRARVNASSLLELHSEIDGEGAFMVKRGHRPQRTCLGCGGRDDQDRLIRLAVTGQDQLSVEPRRGRGGYLHRNQKCQQAFIGRKGLYRAFHVEVSRTAKTRLVEDLASRNWE